MKTVYACFCTDVIHDGHMNIINEAKKYGKLIIGVLSDRSMIKYNRFPTITQEERINLIKKIPQVDEVILQEEIMYDDVISRLKPDYVIHGDNWSNSALISIKNNILKNLSIYGGQLIESPYTQNDKIKKIDKLMIEKLTMPEFRRKRLKKLLEFTPVVKVLQVHSGLTGLIAEKTIIEKDGYIDQYDAMWMSSLCDSTNKGKPDIELVDMTSRAKIIDEVMDVTTKPIIFDGDTGGMIEHFVYNVRTLERMGVSAIIIEDKKGLKKNSLFGTEVKQTQDSVENFCEKISAGKKAQISDDFMIIARCESLILEKGIEDALKRCHAYVKAGADGIMIHSRKKEADEIFEFCDKFREHDKNTPIVVVPTSFCDVTTEEFEKHAVNIVIYANQLIRAAFPAMEDVAKSILINKRSKEVEDDLMPFKNIIRLIDDIYS